MPVYIFSANLCRADLELLQKWRPEYDVTMKKQLSDAGYAEIRDLAHRHRDLYPSLLQLPYSNLSYEVRILWNAVTSLGENKVL